MKLTDNKTGYLKRFQTFVINRMGSSSTIEKDSLLYWRARILFAILFTGLLLCSFVFIAVIPFVIKERLWGLAIMDGAALVTVIGLVLCRLRYEIRAAVTLLLAYIIGVGVILSVGPLSGGPIWLFAFAVLTGVLLGSKKAIVALSINAITLTIMGWLITTGQFGQTFPFFNTPEAMIVAGVNFIFLNAVAAMSVTVLVKGLVSIHQKERALSRTLEIERSQLMKAKERLELEVKERKLAEEALRKSETVLNATQQLAKVGGWEWDTKNETMFWTKETYRIHGFQPDELEPGSSDHIELSLKCYDPEDRPIILDAFKRCADKGQAYNLEFPLITAMGHRIWIRTAAEPVLESDRVVKVVGNIMDITDRKQMEEELLKARKLESLGVLAGGIAHDFNNLLTSVVGNISLAKMEMKRGSKAFRNLVEAEKASLQTKELTARLITFSKGGKPVKETVSIGDLVKDSVGSLLKGSDIDAGVSIPDNISSAEVDEEQMKQVIHNIITNAQEAMAGQGTINVSCENADIGVKDSLTLKDGKYVKISIEDQGPGIPEEDFIKIFDPYFSTKAMGTQKGMGLGLATSDSIVKQHDGLITVESEVDSGSTFHIYLPVLSAESQAPSAKPPESHSQSSIVNSQYSIKRILVMDDEEVVRDVSNALLTHLGYKVEVAVEGVEAIEMYGKAMGSEKPFDMVILDLTNKFGMGGVETIKKLLKIDPDVRAIVATGYSTDPIMSKFREHGFCGALPKPFTLDQLKTALHDAIAGE